MSTRALVFALAVWPAAVLAAPQDIGTRSRALVADAQQRIGNREWESARSLLRMLDADCQSAGNPNSCRPLVDYSIGYLNQTEAATTRPEQRAALLAEARRRYQNVLALQPNNGATLNNLAQVQQFLLLDAQTAEERRTLSEGIIAAWTRAVALDDERASQYAVALGDFLKSQNRPADALRYFHQAAQKSPDQEMPRRRILENASGMTLAAHSASCLLWEAPFPELASRCYERLMLRYREPGQAATPDMNEDALLRWTSLVSRHEWLTPERLQVLPTGWLPQAVSSLGIYVRDPLGDPRRWGWWWQRPNRMAVSAEVTTAVGRQLLIEPVTGPGKAATCWEDMFRARPQMAAEVGESQSAQPAGQGGGIAAVLRVYQDLAALYQRYPALDRDGAKLKKIIGEMFEGKGEAILRRNWKATQGFHMALALIYVERGVWNDRPGATPGAASAIFQLSAALDDADRRLKDPREQFFQPLPEVKALLAQGYVREKRIPEAVRLYIDAAKAYLDTDALDKANQMLDALPGLTPPASAPPELARILAARRNPASLSGSDVSAQKMPWLFTPASNAVTPDFLARQQFKLLADIASASGSGSEAERLDAALRAYQIVTGQRATLVGTLDLLRWQKAESRLLASVNARAASWLVSNDPGTNVPPRGPVVGLTLEGESRPIVVPVDAAAPIAARLVQSVGTQQALAARSYMQVVAGKLVLNLSQAPANLNQMVALIQKDPGLAVEIRK